MTRQLLDALCKQNSLTYCGRLSEPWRKWFQQVQDTHTQFFQTYNLGTGATQVPLPTHPPYTTAERDSLQNVRDGVSIYNTTTSKFNFRENGTWKELP